MDDRVPATDPEAMFTVRALIAHLRELSGAGPGVRLLRREMAEGRLKFVQLGVKWRRIRWGDFQEWIDTQQEQRENAMAARRTSKQTAERQAREAQARPTEAEIQDQITLAMEGVTEGSTKVPGMTYEEGVDAALRWAIGESDAKPIDS